MVYRNNYLIVIVEYYLLNKFNPLFFLLSGGVLFWDDMGAMNNLILGLYGMGFRVYNGMYFGLTGALLKGGGDFSFVALPIIPTLVVKVKKDVAHLFHFVYIPAQVYGMDFSVLSYGFVYKQFLVDIWLEEASAFGAKGVGILIGFVF